jgi:hypothetical protein
MSKTWTVYYRTGGTENFQWHRVGDVFASSDAARDKTEELRQMGYPAHYDRKDTIDAIGLPETFE